VDDPKRGGPDGPDTVLTPEAWLYDPVTDAWSAAPQTPTLRREPAIVSLQGGMILAIGAGISIDTRKVVDAFDPVAFAWRPQAEMAEGRVMHAAALQPDGRVLVAGGSGWDGPLDSVETYDPSTGAWSPGPRLPAIY
jgi:hypothetical protein